MNRLSFAFVAVLAVGCGSKTNGVSSICGDENAPATCGQACDASPGAENTCGAGFYCSEDGMCDQQCSADHACPTGYQCTPDGRCEDDGSGSNEPPGPDASCPAVNFTPMPKTPSIALVLDQSGSMYDFKVNGTSTSMGCTDPECRYRVMREALVGTTGVVTELEAKAYFGASLFTCANNALAAPSVARSLNNAAGVRTLIDSKTGTRGANTPTPQALNDMVAQFATTPPPADSPPVIVLATDGAPNSCQGQGGTEAASVAAATNAYNAGIPVYVLAIGITSQHFQDLANAGQGHVAGTPDIPYYPANNAAQLKTAFQTIINGVISCDLSLTGTIDDTQANQGTVTLNGMALVYGTDWTLVGGNTNHLQGQACTELKSSANPQIGASFPCGAVIF